MNDQTKKTNKPDRLLGDEWEEWSGDLDESVTYHETAGLFTLYAILALLLFLGCLMFALFMIEPRLRLIHPALEVIARIVTVTVMILTAVWGSLIFGSVFTGKNLLLYSRLGRVSTTWILPPALLLARRLGISRDRLGNSFVNFSNAIVRATYKPKKGKTIILMPRCLKSEMKKQIQELAGRADVKVFSATGGGQARKVIREQHPNAVIGIACERDLMSGIQDVAPKIPTIGVANKRPEGPCKNTLLDMEELKKAIEILTGVSLD